MNTIPEGNVVSPKMEEFFEHLLGRLKTSEDSSKQTLEALVALTAEIKRLSNQQVSTNARIDAIEAAQQPTERGGFEADYEVFVMSTSLFIVYLRGLATQ